jgi:uncharacterized protein
MSRIRSALKFIGCWIGPAFLALALWFLLFTTGTWGNLAGLPALIGAVLTGIACLFMRAPERQRQRKIMAGTAVLALGYYGYGQWDMRHGYRTETVRFANGPVRLVGTLYLPERPGRYPGMIVLSGSAATPRSLNRGNALPFVRNGFAVLAYDRRGIGESKGDWNAANFLSAPRDMEPGAQDAAIALEFLRRHREVRPEAVGYMGISEGGWVAPRAAVLSGHAAYLLQIGASPANLSEIIIHQGGKEALAEATRDGFKDSAPLSSLQALNIPSLWLQAKDDTLVPTVPAVRLLEVLKKEGKPVEYRVIPNAWHGLFIGPPNLVRDEMLPWLNRVTASS